MPLHIKMTIQIGPATQAELGKLAHGGKEAMLALIQKALAKADQDTSKSHFHYSTRDGKAAILTYEIAN